ncbi:MAG: DNA-processing protein DprA [Gemmatimonadota bacterium]|nr:DNA-processing protein DprA [Gemmatimonadota bacterium]
MPVAPSALEPLLRLAFVPGIGPGRLATLVNHFGTPERVLAASARELARVPKVGPEMIRRLQAAAGPETGERARSAVRMMERTGAVAMTLDDPAYPVGFRILADPPFLIFAAGRLELLQQPGIGIVGTREPSAYGRSAAAALSGELSRAGYVVVSGMAKGIDSAAHAAALDAGGGTIGVLGHGIDQLYPAENRALFERVRSDGALVTEFPPGERPRPGNFPRRNRLIAALSAGILVVEMGERSGAQHTVNYALEQGKEVFAVPGQIGAPTSAGTNQLLKEGARMVTSVSDVLEELGGITRAEPVRTVLIRSPPAAAAPAGMSAAESAIFEALGAEARHVDDLAAATGLSTSAVLTALLGLELCGAAASLPGKRFRRV